MELTRDELTAAMLVITAMTETIRERGTVSSGELYAMIMNRCTLAGYGKILAMLERTCLVRVGSDHIVRWVGPILPMREMGDTKQ